MNSTFDTVSDELKKSTVKELTECIKLLNVSLPYYPRLKLSGRKDEIVYRIADFVSDMIVERPDLVEDIIAIINDNTSKKVSLTYDSGAIKSTRPTKGQAFKTISEVSFKESPFFKPIARVDGVKLCPMSSNSRQSKSFQFTLSEENRKLLTMPNAADDRPPYQLRFYCARYTGATSDLIIEFPSVCELKVNDSVIQGNSLRCIKGRPGTVNPPDITIMVKKQAANNVDLIYINNEYSYVAGVYIVERTAVSQLIEIMKETRVLSKAKVLEKLQQIQEDADIIMESETLQTKDPLAFTRIVTPIRSKECQHLQCFDANVFLTMNEQTPTWTCPVCNRRIESWEDLIVDEYFTEMLASTPKHVDSVRVEPNGHITIIDENPGLADDDDDEDSEEELLYPVKNEETEINPILLDDDSDQNEEPATSSSQQSIPSNSNQQSKKKHSETLEPSQSPEVPRQKRQKNHNVIDLTLDSDDEDVQANTVPFSTNDNINSNNETLILPHFETLYNLTNNHNNPTSRTSNQQSYSDYMNVYKYN